MVAKVVAMGSRSTDNGWRVETTQSAEYLHLWRVGRRTDETRRTPKRTGGQEVPGSIPGSPTERNPSSQEVVGTHPSRERAGIRAVNASISCALTDWSLGQVQSQERGGLTAATFLGQRATSRQCKKTMERVMPGCMLRNALDPSSSATVSLARHQLAYPRTGVRQ